MATELSKATSNVKRFLLYFLIFVVVVIIINTVSGWLQPKPPVPSTYTNTDYPKADRKFSTIPEPQIQSLITNNNTLGLISKKPLPFPTFPPIVNVYKINPEREYLGDAANARKVAGLLQLPTQETRTVNNVIYWETPDKNKTLSYDKFQRYWSYSSKSASLPGALTQTSTEYLDSAFSFLSTMGLSNDYFSQRSGRVDLVSMDTQRNLTSLTTDPNVARVSLYKKVLMAKPTNAKVPDSVIEVRNLDYYKGAANFWITGKGAKIENELIDFSYKEFEYDPTFAVYDLKPVDEAYDALQKNKGYLFRLTLIKNNLFGDYLSLQIKDYQVDPALTRIVYIEPENRDPSIPWTNYLQPFYLFEGTATTTNNQDASFSFLVEALKATDYGTP
jgi:hypothetical protein